MPHWSILSTFKIVCDCLRSLDAKCLSSKNYNSVILNSLATTRGTLQLRMFSFVMVLAFLTGLIATPRVECQLVQDGDKQQHFTENEIALNFWLDREIEDDNVLCLTRKEIVYYGIQQVKVLSFIGSRISTKEEQVYHFDRNGFVTSIQRHDTLSFIGKTSYFHTFDTTGRLLRRVTMANKDTVVTEEYYSLPDGKLEKIKRLYHYTDHDSANNAVRSFVHEPIYCHFMYNEQGFLTEILEEFLSEDVSVQYLFNEAQQLVEMNFLRPFLLFFTKADLKEQVFYDSLGRKQKLIVFAQLIKRTPYHFLYDAEGRLAEMYVLNPSHPSQYRYDEKGLIREIVSFDKIKNKIASGSYYIYSYYIE